MLSHNLQLIPRRLRNIQNPFEYFAQRAENIIKDYKSQKLTKEEAERRLLEIEEDGVNLMNRIFN